MSLEASRRRKKSDIRTEDIVEYQARLVVRMSLSCAELVPDRPSRVLFLRSHMSKQWLPSHRCHCRAPGGVRIRVSKVCSRNEVMKLSRRGRNPCLRPTLPFLFRVLAICLAWNTDLIVPSSFSSSFLAGASAAASGAAPPAAGAAAAPPPEPTFRSMSLTSLPSSACGLSVSYYLNDRISTNLRE